MIELEQVDLFYLENGPLKLQTRVNIQAPVEFVFKIFEDGEAWVANFDTISRVEWTTEKPHKKGTRRVIDLTVAGAGEIMIDEEFLVWEQNKRFVFIFKASNEKVFSAMIEDYKFSEAENGSTDIVWDLACEGAGVFKALFPQAMPEVAKDAQKSLNNFKTYIEKKYAQSQA